MLPLMKKNMLLDLLWQSIKNVVDLIWLDIPVLQTMSIDNMCFDLMGMRKIIAVLPKLIVIATGAINLFNLFC